MALDSRSRAALVQEFMGVSWVLYCAAVREGCRGEDNEGFCAELSVFQALRWLDVSRALGGRFLYISSASVFSRSRVAASGAGAEYFFTVRKNTLFLSAAVNLSNEVLKS